MLTTTTQANHQPLPLHVQLQQKAGKLIEVLDKLKDCLGGQAELSFPQIIVVGQESSGKSSVLERLAMLQFFPRGKNITTRMPIEVRLKHLDDKELRKFCETHKQLVYSPVSTYVRAKYEGTDGGEIWSHFLANPSLEEEIMTHMERAVSMKNKRVQGFIADRMVIEVTASNTPNLTLVDLPGIVSARCKGEPDDVMETSRALVEMYLRQPHTLVLAVVPAYERIRNSQAFQLVQKHKKEAHTIGVLTMADLAENPNRRDPFEDLKDKLDGTAGDCVDLTHGFVAVRNRDSQLQENLEAVSSQEMAWFNEKMPGYVEQGKASSDKLSEKLISMLCSYVESTWKPAAEKKIRSELNNTQKAITNLGIRPSLTMVEEQRVFLRELVAYFTKNWLVGRKWDHPKELVQATISSTMTKAAPSHADSYPSQVLYRKSAKEQVKKAILRLPDTVANSLCTVAGDFLQRDNNQPLCIKRFHKFREAIKICIRDYLNPYCRNAVQTLEAEVPHLLFSLGSTVPTAQSHTLVEPLTAFLEEEILVHVLQSDFADSLSNMMIGKNRDISQLFEEDRETSDRRKQLEETVTKLQGALRLLSSLS